MTKHTLQPPSEYQKKICRYFAESCVFTNKDEYSRRSQSNTKKIVKDIYYGKVAECMVFDFLLKKGKLSLPPDFMLYSKKYKSFDSDLRIDNSNIHIKSCINGGKFPNSWLFQPYDTLTTSPSPKDFLALVVLSAASYAYFLPALNAIDLYQEPLKKSLNKKVIYEKKLLR